MFEHDMTIAEITDTSTIQLLTPTGTKSCLTINQLAAVSLVKVRRELGVISTDKQANSRVYCLTMVHEQICRAQSPQLVPSVSFGTRARVWHGK